MPAQDFIGLVGPEYEMDVERGHIRRFARAMNAPLAEFTEGRHPVIPATFLVSTAYTWGYSLERPRGTLFEQIDHDLSVSLHAGESFQYHGPLPRAGDRFRCRASLEDVKVRAGGRGGDLTFITVLTEYRNERGELAVEQRSTSVTTGQAPNDEGWEVDLPEYDPDYPSHDPDDCFAELKRQGWDDLREGSGPGQLTAPPLRLRDIVHFQGVVGEDDPLHHDFSWANKHDYPSVFGLGTHQASLIAGYAAHWLDPNAVRAYSARFRNIIWPGDEMTYNGMVERKYQNPDSGQRMVDLALDCRRANGEVLVDVRMTLDLGPG